MGGGGSAGKIEHAAYLEEIHAQFLSHEELDTPTKSITDVFNETLPKNPFIGELPYSPDDQLTLARNELNGLKTLVTALNPVTDYRTFILAAESNVDEVMNTDYLTSAELLPAEVTEAFDTATAAFAASLNDTIDNTILPPYKAGMHNINAVTSSAFVIGEAIIRGMAQRDTARFSADLRAESLKTASIQRNDAVIKFNTQRNEMIRVQCGEMVSALMKKIDLTYTTAHLNLQTVQMTIAAKSEEKDDQLTIDEYSAKWEINLFQPVANMIASPSGGVAPGTNRPNKAIRVASGALGGAATGATIGSAAAEAGLVGSAGGVYGAIIGAVVGAGIALAS